MKTMRIRLLRLAAAQCGKALPYRDESKRKRGYASESRRSLISITHADRKGKAFPHCAAAKPQESDRGTGFGTFPGRANFFRRKLCLHKQQKVVAAAGLRIGARHVEAAERMHADQRARAFAIQVQITNVEFVTRAIEF